MTRSIDKKRRPSRRRCCGLVLGSRWGSPPAAAGPTTTGSSSPTASPASPSRAARSRSRISPSPPAWTRRSPGTSSTGRSSTTSTTASCSTRTGRRGRHRAHPVPRHGGAERGERRHLRRRHDVHLPPARGRQVPAAGQPRGHGGRLQVQLRAHDARAACPGHVVLHGRRRRRQVHGRQGRRDHRLQGRRRLHRRDHARAARTSRSSTRSPWTSATWCPRSGWRSGASSSTAIRWAPARSSFQKWTPGREIVLTRNPDYWEEGKPYLDGVNYQLSFNPPTALLKLRAGEIDILGDDIPVADLRTREDRPEVEDADLLAAAGRDQLHVLERRDEAVRRRQGAPGAQLGDQPRQACQAPGGPGDEPLQIYPEGMPGYEEGKVYYRYDPAKAKQLLAQAGYPDGFKTMLYTDNVDPNPKLWQSMQADLPPSASRPSLKTMSNNSFYVQQGTPNTTHSRQLRLVAWTSPTPTTGSARCSARRARSRAA